MLKLWSYFAESDSDASCNGDVQDDIGNDITPVVDSRAKVFERNGYGSWV